MSGTNEKKTGASRRKEQDRQEIQNKRKMRATTITVVAIVAVLFIGALFVNSKYIRRTLTAVTVDGVKFTAAEYDYFFNNAYYEYQSMVYQSMPDYASSMLPTSGKPLRSQVYDSATGKTWADFFSESAFNKMGETARFYNAANSAGFTIPDEDREKFETEMSTMLENAELYGYSSFEKYLQAVFGSSMNEKTLLKVAEVVNLADSYSRHTRESFAYSPEALEEHYNEKRDSFDSFTFRYFLVKPEEVPESDYETTVEYEEAELEALDAATKRAEEIAAAINSEADYIAAALEYDSESFQEPDSTLRHYSGDMLGSEYGDWLRDSIRKTGDITTVEISTGCYIVMFIDRSSNEYKLANMRHILISPATVNQGEFGDDDAAYADALDNANKEAKEKADEVLALFEEGGATEEKFLELMPNYTSDVTEGGLYENIYRYQSNMSEDLNAWLLDPVRKVGDYTTIYSENSGYHFVYFTGHGERYRDFLAENSLRDTDYNAWVESLGSSETITHWAFVLRSM